MTQELPSSGPGSWAGGGQFERDLELTDADFARIRQLIYQRAGIVLAEHKREMVYSRLAKRLRHHGLTRFADYLARLERQPDAREWEAFTNALTTNLTAFFREAHHFPLLATHVRERRGPVRVWSSAASTGEEPYSIAMTLAEALGSRAGDAEVVATDIDTEALEKARAGVYAMEQIHKLDEARVKRFFQRGRGAHEGLARVRQELKDMVDFQPLNLLAPSWSIQGPFDAIFCRNVMIYFDKQTQARILERFAPLLKPDGLLFAGHSENFSYTTEAFRLRGQTVYVRKAR
ncbi:MULTISPECIES: protein-glutamate O-methyltransferase CheR [Halomonas]|uniref:Chemotaxis protein methyltransferase n=1 Tax=Halomonas halophila TaxID=29573 RepID=A0ABQ0U6B2_9GAMM|nr:MULTISPECIES: protein-glutamate O-methyltransferase CheR [Halomonas]MDR5889015.1 protein-glutamate O-methyltransferase CheR [Halomonas salina]RAH39106.1 protein-glutamate O-methyltransferase CheR [Halomonas sp. SL1]WJY07423.1 protein-glutamate O-methyltransferase CheR [Halomonas halophila]GEK74064.1 chemotaxis protein methyltransferase [Halomonas halophila]